MIESSEEKTTAASYIISFYQEVQALNHNYANYDNVLMEIETKYSKDSEKMPPEHGDVIMQQSQIIRYYCTKTYILYSSIVKGMNKKIDKQLLELYHKLKKHLIVDREDVEKYVIQMNSVLIDNVMKNLLQSSTEIVNKIYGEK